MTKSNAPKMFIGLRLNDTDRAMLDALMARYGWNDQDMLRQLIREGYARMDAQATPRSVTTAPADDAQGFD